MAANVSAEQEPTAISDTARWRRRLEGRAGRHSTVALRRPIELRLAVRRGLARSLPVFQIGETGDGIHLLRGAWGSGQLDYVRACELFVREEQEHARLLGVVLDELGVARRTAHWSDGVFQALRRLGGLRTEVLLLLVAELVAVRYYAVLRDGVGDADLSALFARIQADEELHLDFHADTLPAHLATLPAPVLAVVRRGWGLLAAGTIVVVAVGHRPVLRACGVPARRFVAETYALLRHHGPRFFPAAATEPGAVAAPAVATEPTVLASAADPRQGSPVVA